jgi:TolA-binding protein
MFYTKRLFAFAAALLLASCSTTKDRWVNRKYHEVTAHYNAYFNGEEAFDEAVEQFQNGEEWDFEQFLPIYFWPDADQAPGLFSKMDRAIEKSAKVVKKHSMVFAGKQKNDYVFKAYLLIARSRFYKHELIQTLEATSYIEDNFGRIELAEDEVFWAKLLAAQTHIRMENFFQAEQQLDELYTKNLPKAELHQAQKTMAYFHFSQEQWAEAQGWVAAAAQSASVKSEKVRLTYLNAQFLAKLGKGYESALAYEDVLKLHPDDYDITFSAQIKRAENFDVFMEDISIIEKALNKMLRDDKNITYRDQIYYVWALKELDLEYYPEAEVNLRKSIAASVDNARQKGKSYLKLAGIAFDFKSFVNAQAYYDSAIAVLPMNYPGLDTLEERTSVLNDLVAQLNVVALEDSLQSMYGLNDQALRQKFEDYIEAKQAREEEAARRAEIAAMRAAENALLADAGPQAGGGSGQWYFYNPTVRAKGVAAFKRTWGNRTLEDHWRTKDKPVQGFAVQQTETTDSTTSDSTKALLPSDENSVDYYLARVLKTDDDLKASLQREAVAKSELGFIYKDGLKDNNEAELAWADYMNEFESFAQTTPKVLYGQYLLFNEQEAEDKGEAAKSVLLTNYENSPYAALLRGEKKGPKIPLEEQEAYDAAFVAYESGQFKSATALLHTFTITYPNSALLPKTGLLSAYIIGTSGDVESTIEALQEVVKAYSGTEEATRAAQLLSMLQDEERGSEEGPNRGMGDLKVNKVDFQRQDNAPHKFILAIPAENSNINELRNALADFNKEFFKFDNLRIQNIFYDQNTQLIIVSGLRTKEKAVVYLNTFNQQGTLMEQYYPKAQSAGFYINNPNFGKVYRDKVLKEYLQYFDTL